MSLKKLALVLALGVAFMAAPTVAEAKVVVSHPAKKLVHKKTPKKKKVVVAHKKHALTAKKVAGKTVARTAAKGWKHHPSL